MKIVIIGNSGSGKTWLAKQLAFRLHAELIHLDALFWASNGFQEKRSSTEVAQLIKARKKADSWIVEGVFGQLVEPYLSEADTLIWLDLPWPRCEQRLVQRSADRQTHMDREQTTADLAKLIQWAARYYERRDHCSFVYHQKLFQNFQMRRFNFTNERDIETFLTLIDDRKLNFIV